MADYYTTKELANEWGITPARVSALCAEGKLDGAIKKKGVWYIPFDVKKPFDRRQTEASIEKRKNQFRFIDLFAGVGGFHQAMEALGGRCVMASEIDLDCRETYKKNYKVENNRIWGDINEIDPLDIPEFDVLCAGFPCQPFSKAGLQKGFNDEKRGNFFFTIMDILDAHKEVKFILLENVRNLADKTQNWEIITKELQSRNFYITENPIILSPSDFGLPQIRERVYILGINKSIKNDELLNNGCIHIEDLQLENKYKKCTQNKAWSILEEATDDYRVSDEEEEMILAWEEFRRITGLGVVGYPIWISAFGVQIDDEEEYKKQVHYDQSPDWKKLYFDRNRSLYLNNKRFIDKWINEHDMTKRIKLYQKFEWNCGNDVDDIRNAIIQIRQSGIRVKRPTYFPSLVAIVNTPIVWDGEMGHFRRITEREAANLQSFRKRFEFVKKGSTAYMQLGNSVNVKVLKILAKQLFRLAESGWKE